MTYNEKLKLLLRYGQLETEIRDQQAMVNRWRSQAERITPRYGAGGAHSESAGFTVALEKALELEKEMERDLEEAKRLYQVISQGIQDLNSPLQATVLRKRFLLGYSPEKIARQLHYDVSYIHKQKKDGIKNLKLSTFVHSDRDKL